MTDLAEKLDQNKRQRLMAAVRELGAAEYRDLMISLIDGIGVRVQSAKEEQGTLIIHGQGEESYLILASRLDFADPELIVRSLLEEAKALGRSAVFMTLQELDTGTLNYLEKEKVSYADRDKFLSLLQKYGLDEPLLVKEDLKVLEDRGEPCLPSVCKLEVLLEEAEERRGKGDLVRAVQVLDQALEIKPLNDSLWLKKAEYQLEMGRATEALASANRAAELRSGDAATWFLIALIQNQLEDREKELVAYDNVLRIDPRHALALLNKGATLYELGRLEWSLKIFNDLVQRYPQEPRGWNNRGLVLKGLGRLTEAQASFEKSIVLDRDFADPLINIARLLEERGDLGTAVEAWKDVLRLVDSRADIWAHLGSCLRDMGKNDDALTALDRALDLDPSQEQVRHERNALKRIMGEEAPGAAEVPEGQVLRDAAVQEGPPSPTHEIPAGLTEGTIGEVPDQTMSPAGGGTRTEEAVEQTPETSVVSVDQVLPATAPEERSLQEFETPGALEVVPETPKPMEVRKDHLAIEVPPGSGGLQLVDRPTEGPERAPMTPVEIVQEAVTPVCEGSPAAEIVQRPLPPSEVKEEVREEAPEALVQRPKPVWPHPVLLHPLPAEREERMRQEADLLLAGGQREKALQVAELGLKEGSDLVLMRSRARALLSLGRGEEAAEALKEALRYAPSDARTVLDLEALFHRYGGEGARLLKNVDDCPEARNRAALERLERQEYAELARMEVKGEALPVKHAKALALMRLGRYRDASKLLKVIISEFPAFAEGLNNIGVCMRFMGEFDYDQAIHMMQLALEVDPHYSDAMNNIGCTFFAAGRYDQAFEALRTAVDEDRRPEYLLNLSNAQMALGDVQGAKESLTTALKMDEGADTLYMLAVIAESEKQHRWALNLYQDALEKSPGFREAQAGRDRTRLLVKK